MGLKETLKFTSSSSRNKRFKLMVQPKVNFINILLAAFSNESIFSVFIF